MPDSLDIRMPDDRAKINLGQPWEVQYWTKELGCTESQLKEAIKKVGYSVTRVRENLNK